MPSPDPTAPPKGLLAILGPGMLVAATGVGAGDLATAAFAGNKLGVNVLWAVIVGALFKLVLNEGLARWQLVTNSTLLEGAIGRWGNPLRWLFGCYLLVWSFFVGSALISACGVAMHALIPLGEARTDKILYGLLHSAGAVVLVKWGGYKLVSKVMGSCIAVMFLVVILTALAVHPPWGEVIRGLMIPSIPQLEDQGLQWTVALLGGVGGTVTVLCYGYWIREAGRHGVEDLRICRIDLWAGYSMTAFFGLAMVIIGSQTAVTGGGARLIVELAANLQAQLGALGPTLRWAFLIGAWGMVFSSLLGVWQSVPYLFADLWTFSPSRNISLTEGSVDTHAPAYQLYLYGIASVPALGLWSSFEQAQKLYAIFGALFMPMLALTLILMNGSKTRIPAAHRNPPLITLLLLSCLTFFLWTGWQRFFG